MKTLLFSHWLTKMSLLRGSIFVLFFCLTLFKLSAQSCTGNASLISSPGCFPNVGTVELSGSFTSCIDELGNVFNNPQFINQPAGARDYTFFGTDANQQPCIQTVTVTVPVVNCNLSFQVSAQAPTNSCQTNGTISLSQVSNSACLTWTNSQGFSVQTLSQSSFAPGTYTITLDNEGCQASRQITVPNGCNLALNNLSGNDATTGNNGSINFTAVGAVCGSKTFILRKLINNVFQTQSGQPLDFGNNLYEYQNLSPGDYQVEFKDGSAVCSTEGFVTIGGGTTSCTISISDLAIIPSSGLQNPDGKITFNLSHTSPNLPIMTLKKNTGSGYSEISGQPVQTGTSGFEFGNLVPGEYRVVAAAAGCKDSSEVSLNYCEGYALIFGNQTISTGQFGKIEVELQDGFCTPAKIRIYVKNIIETDVKILWKEFDLNSNKFILEDVPSGVYEVEVSSLNPVLGCACTQKRSFEIKSICPVLSNAFYNATTRDKSGSDCMGSYRFKIPYKAVGGTGIKVYKIIGTIQTVITPEIETEVLSSGEYQITIQGLDIGWYGVNYELYGKSLSAGIVEISENLKGPCQTDVSYFIIEEKACISPNLPSIAEEILTSGPSCNDGKISEYISFGNCQTVSLKFWKKAGPAWTILEEVELPRSGLFNRSGLGPGQYRITVQTLQGTCQDTGYYNINYGPCNFDILPEFYSPSFLGKPGLVKFYPKNSPCNLIWSLKGSNGGGPFLPVSATFSTSYYGFWNGENINSFYDKIRVIGKSIVDGVVVCSDSTLLDAGSALSITILKKQNPSATDAEDGGFEFGLSGSAGPALDIKLQKINGTTILNVNRQPEELGGVYAYKNLLPGQYRIIATTTNNADSLFVTLDGTPPPCDLQATMDSVVNSKIPGNITGIPYRTYSTTASDFEGVFEQFKRRNTVGVFENYSSAVSLESLSNPASLSAPDLPAGIYRVLIFRPFTNCKDSLEFVIDGGPCLMDVNIASTTNVDFISASNGSVRFSVSGSVNETSSFYQFQKKNPSGNYINYGPALELNYPASPALYQQNGLGMGEYRVIAFNGTCADTANFVIDVNCSVTLPTTDIVISRPTSPGCFDGKIQLSTGISGCPSADFAAYLYQDGIQIQVRTSLVPLYLFENLTAGTYKVKVKSPECPCSDSATVVIPEGICSLDIQITDVTEATPCNGRRGTIEPNLVNTASCHPVQLRVIRNGLIIRKYNDINNLSLPAVFTGLERGQYALVLVDTVNGCSDTAKTSIPDAPCGMELASVSTTTPTINTLGSIEFTLFGPSCKIPVLKKEIAGQFQITSAQATSLGEDQFRFNNLNPGNYLVIGTVPPGGACKDSTGITVPPVPNPCDLDVQLDSIHLTTTGGKPYRTYSGSSFTGVFEQFRKENFAGVFENLASPVSLSVFTPPIQISEPDLTPGKYRILIYKEGTNCRDSIEFIIAGPPCSRSLEVDSTLPASSVLASDGKAIIKIGGTVIPPTNTLISFKKLNSITLQYQLVGFPIELDGGPTPYLFTKTGLSKGFYLVIVQTNDGSCKDSIGFAIDGAPCKELQTLALQGVSAPGISDGFIEFRTINGEYNLTDQVSLEYINMLGIYVPLPGALLQADLFLNPVLLSFRNLPANEYRLLYFNPLTLCRDTLLFGLPVHPCSKTVQLQSVQNASAFGETDGSASMLISGTQLKSTDSYQLYKRGPGSAGFPGTFQTFRPRVDFTGDEVNPATQVVNGLGRGDYYFKVFSRIRECSDSAFFSISSPLPSVKPTISPATGTFSGPQMVSISVPVFAEGNPIYYTLDGSVPNLSLNPVQTRTYTGPFEVAESKTVKAIVVVTDYASVVETAVLTIIISRCAQPVISGGTSDLEGFISLVTMQTATTGASIYYTTNGNAPRLDVPNSFTFLYNGPFLPPGNCTVKAMAVKSGLANSSVSTRILSLNANSFVPAPVITPGSGTHNGPLSVTIVCAMPGASIYYTTNGIEPNLNTTNSFTKLYSGSLVFNGNVQIKAIAVRSGKIPTTRTLANLSVTPGMVVANPVISPPGGAFIAPTLVSISCSTPGATIYYTTNGNTPRTDIPNFFTKVYSVPFFVNGNSTVRAVAIAPGMVNSSVVVANFSGPFFREAIADELQEGIDSEMLFRAWPNPGSGLFHLEMANPGEGRQIEIRNAMGQLLITKTWAHSGGILDLQDYPSGIYFATIRNGDNKKEIRLIKNE